MSERATLVWVVLALVGIVVAVGAGPAMLLARRHRPAIVLAPLIGLGLCSALLTTAAAIMPLGIAAYAVLAPAAALSLLAACVLRARGRRVGLRAAALPAVVAVAALLVALAHGLSLGSAGPYTGGLRDAWWYVAMGDWLLDHTVWATPTEATWLHDLMGATGWVALQVNARLGLTAVVPAAAELLGVTTDVVLYPAMVLQFALLPLALWASARAIGIRPLAATLAALLGLSALPLSLVYDTALGNLAGIVFTPLAIAFGISAVRTGSRADIALAAVFGAALVSSYPEFVPALALVGIAGAAWVVLRARRRRDLRSLASPAKRVALVGAGVAVLAPFALARLVEYLLWADGATHSLVDRGLSPRTVGAWATGLMHPYQLGEIAGLSAGMQVLLVVGPLLLLALGVHGAFARRDAGDVLLVLVPIVVAAVLGIYVLKTGAIDEGDCQYCLAKALTFGFPSLAIGIGLGVQALVVLARGGRRWSGALAASGLVAVAAIAVGIGLGTQRMASVIERDSAFVPPQARALAEDGKRLGITGPVFIEGVETTGDVVSLLPALYQTVAKMPGAYAAYDMESVEGFDLHLVANPAYWGRILPRERYEDPRYRYVLSTYSGLDSGREVLARHGRYALERRNPVDVTVHRLGPVIGGRDRRAEQAARPIVTSSAKIRVASSKAGPGHVLITAQGPESPNDAFLVAADPEATPTEHSMAHGGSTTCFTLRLRRGFTTFGVYPAGGAPMPLTITRTRAGRGPCPAAASPIVLPPRAVVGGTAFPQEPLFVGDPAQWIGTRATVDLLPNGTDRPAARVRLAMVSFAVPQTVTVTLNGRVLGRAVASMDFARPAELEVRVPAGHGPARLRLTASPGALPATRVNPADDRRLAVALGPPEVELLPD